MSYRLPIALALLLATPSVALAERDATPEETARVVGALEALGYTSISDVDVIGARFIVDARAPSGHEVDVEVDQKTLRVVGERQS